MKVLQYLPYKDSLYQVSTERSDLYRCRPTEGLQVPLLVQPGEIEYGVLTEAYIEVSVQVLKGVIARVPSGMCAEYLKGWLWEATRNKGPLRIQ